MTLANVLLRAKKMGVRKFRDNASHFVGGHNFLIITERGNPASVLVPYDDILEIADILDELEDKETLKIVAEGRRAIRKGAKGILVSSSFGRKQPLSHK